MTSFTILCACLLITVSIKIDLDEFIDRLQMSHMQRRARAADACFEGTSDAVDFPLSLTKIPQGSSS